MQRSEVVTFFDIPLRKRHCQASGFFFEAGFIGYIQCCEIPIDISQKPLLIMLQVIYQGKAHPHRFAEAGGGLIGSKFFGIGIGNDVAYR